MCQVRDEDVTGLNSHLNLLQSGLFMILCTENALSLAVEFVIFRVLQPSDTIVSLPVIWGKLESLSNFYQFLTEFQW